MYQNRSRVSRPTRALIITEYGYSNDSTYCNRLRPGESRIGATAFLENLRARSNVFATHRATPTPQQSIETSIYLDSQGVSIIGQRATRIDEFLHRHFTSFCRGRWSELNSPITETNQACLAKMTGCGRKQRASRPIFWGSFGHLKSESILPLITD